MTLSEVHATLISGFVAGSYVAGLYLVPSARLSFSKTSQQVHASGERAREPHERWRDDTDVIKGRLKAAVISTCINCCVVYACLVMEADRDKPWKSSLRLLGIKPPSPQLTSVIPYILTLILYTGPLTAHYLSGTLPFQSNWSYHHDFRPLFTTWLGIRNFVVAPITEELVFRSCLLAVADMSGRGTYHKIFITPLWFGVAHLHHAYELYNRFGRTKSAFVRSVIICLVQLTYTTLFGAYTAFLLLRTNCIFPSITAHITANILGFPQPGWELRQHPHHKIVICVGYIVGISAFVFTLVSGIV